jgi:hypothetical protein
MNTRQWMSLILVFVVIVAGFLLFKKFRSTSPKLTSSVEEPMVNAFHPDSVLGFQWKTKGKALSFFRMNRDKAWSPDVPTPALQERLNMIAIADYKPVEKVGDPILKVIVAFGQENQWDGVFDGKYFVWTDGHLKGQGFEVPPRYAPKFEAGAYAFGNKGLNWCPQRIKSLEAESGSIKYKLYQQQLKWVLNDKEVDPTFVEQWLGRACSNHLDEYIDQSLVDSKYKFDGKLAVKFTDGRSLQWKWDSSSPAFDDGKEWFLSPSLDGHLKELAAAPVIGEAPAAPSNNESASAPAPVQKIKQAPKAPAMTKNKKSKSI